MRHYSGGFFYNPKKNEVLLHKRDGNTTVNPHKWGFFGGGNEEGETALETFIREIQEELNISLTSQEVTPLRDYLNTARKHRHVFYVVSEKPKSEMILGEGADFDWIPLNNVFSYDLTDKTIDDLRYFTEHI